MKNYLYRGIPTERFRWIYIDKHLFPDFFLDDFVIGSLIINKDRTYICRSGMASSRHFINNGITTMIEVEPDSVGQYLMCEDKNGRMIFEGDILKGTEQRSNSSYMNGQYLGSSTWEVKINHIAELTPSNWTLIMNKRNNAEVVSNTWKENYNENRKEIDN